MKLSSRGAPRTGLERPLCCGPLRTWRLENLVGAATAVALEVEGNVRVADLFKGLGHFRRSSVLQELPHFSGGHLAAGQVKRGVRSAECGMGRLRTRVAIPHSEFRTPHFMVADADIVQDEGER